MSSINKVVLVGNTTRDAEVKYVGANNTALTTVGLALNRKYGDKEETTFVDVTFFGKLAEIVGEYVTKGSQIAVDGRLRQESWETDGQKRSKLVVIAENMQMLGSKGDKAAKTSTKTSTKKSDASDAPQNTDEIPF